MGADGAREPRAPRRRGRRLRAPATAPGSSSSCPTSSSARSSTSSCPPRRPVRRRRLLPAARRPRRRQKLEELIELNVRVEGQRVLGWRDVPGRRGARRRRPPNRTRPVMRQVFVGRRAGRARTTRTPSSASSTSSAASSSSPPGPDFYAASFSSPHGRLEGHAHPRPAPRLLPRPAAPERCTSALALVHSRFSHEHVPELGARPPVPRDRPQRRDQHAHGQRELDARARERSSPPSSSARDLHKVMPIVRPGGSDSATFDNVLELLMLAGRSLPHAVMMMIPEAYAGPRRPARPPQGLLRLPLVPHGAVGRPGRGRASPTAASSARRSTATACAPAAGRRRKDGHVVLGSEAGLLAIQPPEVERLGRLQPGKLFLVDLERGPHRRRRRGQARGRHPAALRRVVRATTPSTSPTSSPRT